MDTRKDLEADYKMSQKKHCFGKRATVTFAVSVFCVLGFLVNSQRETISKTINPETFIFPTIFPFSVQAADLKTHLSSSSLTHYVQHPSLPLKSKLRKPQSLDGQDNDAQFADDAPFAEHLPFLHHSMDVPTSLDVTIASRTTVKLATPDYDSIYVGDTLHYVIEAKDSWGNPRPIGGDFWMAVLQSPHLGAGTAPRIVDHDNGTYSMYFIAGWVGDAILDLTLAHPSEAVHWLKTTYKYGDHLPKWDGVFRMDKIEEQSTCYILYDSTWNHMCEYQPKKALKHTKFVCQKPSTLPCESLIGIYGASNFPGEFSRLLPQEKKVLFQGPHLYKKVPVPHGFITIKERSLNQSTIPKDSLSLPACGTDIPVPLSDGYWYKGQWNSLVCNTVQPYEKTSALQCLKHTNVVFTGDSTTRQWFASLAELFDVGRPEDHERTFTLERTISKYDINISFIFHPLSTHPKPVLVNMSQVRFEVDILLDLSQHTCKHVIVISPWAHFIMWPWDAYVEWLTHIRDAMLDVKQRCPKLKVVIKSPHAVNKVDSMKGRDFIFLEMMKAMRDVFQGSGVLFIDIWDMDYAYPSPMVLHMPKNVINQEIAMFLSFVCPEKLPSQEEQKLLLDNVKVL